MEVSVARGSAGLAGRSTSLRLSRRCKVGKQPGHSQAVPVCAASYDGQDNGGNSAATRQARFLQEIDRLASERRVAGMPRPKSFTSAPPSINGAGPGQQQYSNRDASAPPTYKPSDQATRPEGSPSGAVTRSASTGMLRSSDAGQARMDSKSNTKAKFILTRRVDYGQRIKVVGSDGSLGAWKLEAAPEMKWSEGDRWHVTAELPAGGVYEYKYVVLDAGGKQAVDWQRGNNNVLALRPDEDVVEIQDNWDCNPGAAVIANGVSSTREHRLAAWAGQMDAMASSKRAELRRTRMELAHAQEEARVARADSSRLKAQLARTQTDLLAAERLNRDLQRTNQVLRAQLAESSLTFHKAFETAQRLLSGDGQSMESGGQGSGAQGAVSDAAQQLASSASALLRGQMPGSAKPPLPGTDQQGSGPAGGAAAPSSPSSSSSPEVPGSRLNKFPLGGMLRGSQQQGQAAAQQVPGAGTGGSGAGATPPPNGMPASNGSQPQYRANSQSS